MIKQIFWLSYYITLVIFGNIVTVQAKTNYDALHTKHDIVAKYECGKLGYQAISKDGYGGYSYGKWQISTWRKNNLPSTFDFFLTYLKDNNYKYYDILIQAGGYRAAYAGNKNFINIWKKIATEKSFRNSYDNFLLKKEIIPVYIRMDKNGNSNFNKLTSWASEDNAIQAAVKSTIIQHGQGGAYKIFQSICFNKNILTKEKFLEKLYTYRKIKYPEYKARYNAEYDDLKNYLLSGQSIIKNKKEEVIVAKVKNPDTFWQKLVKLFS